MRTNFTIKLDNNTYFCSLRYDGHCYILSCEDKNGNDICYSTGLSEDTYKLIKLMLLADNIVVEEDINNA